MNGHLNCYNLAYTVAFQVDGYVGHFGLALDPETLRHEALEWATTRGSRSGRTAWQFIQDLAGRLGKPLEG